MRLSSLATPPALEGRWRHLAGVAAGVAFGATTSILNHSDGAVAPYLSTVLGSSWGWLGAACVASVAPRYWLSLVHTLEFLIPAVLAYYGFDSAAGVYGVGGAFEAATLVADVAYWAVLSGVVSAGLALLNLGARRGRVVGLACAAAVPVYISIDALSLHAGLTRLPWADPHLLRASLYVGVTAALCAVEVFVGWVSAPAREGTDLLV